MRIKRNSSHILVPVSVMNDTKLSYKARGVYFCLMALPDNSDINKVASMAKDGKRSLKSGLEELTNAGYIKKTESGVLEVVNAYN